MIVVDSSALLAILSKEPEKQSFQSILAGAERYMISAVNAHETASVLRLRHGQAMIEEFWRLLVENEIAPFDEKQARAAAVALDRHRKSIDSKARLNLCDCAAYASRRPRMRPCCSRAAILWRRTCGRRGLGFGCLRWVRRLSGPNLTPWPRPYARRVDGER